MNSRLALGTVQFGLAYGITNSYGRVPFAVAKQMVEFAKNAGIDTVDTAIGYGESEKVLGAIGVNSLKLISKLPPMPNSINERDIRGWVLGQIQSSLERLGVDRLHGLLLHRPSDLAGGGGNELYSALLYLKDSGKTDKLGISIYSPEELKIYEGRFKFDLIQAPFNLVDQRLVTSGLLKKMKDEGYEVHVRSIFLQGLLLIRRVEMPEQFEQWGEIWDRWDRWLIRNNEEALRACISFPMSFQEIDRIIVGSVELEQLKQIILSANIGMSECPLPDLRCNDENLINPTKWPALKVYKS